MPYRQVSRRRQKQPSGVRVHARRSDLPTAAPAQRSAGTSGSRLIMPTCCFLRTQTRQEELAQFTANLRRIPGAGGLVGWGQPFEGSQLTQDTDVRIEHFGFRDGISNPVIEGFPRAKRIRTRRASSCSATATTKNSIRGC